MPASGLREAHFRGLKAALTITGSNSGSSSPTLHGTPRGSREDWLRQEEQLIRAVDPSFDASLLCPASLAPNSPCQDDPGRTIMVGPVERSRPISPATPTPGSACSPTAAAATTPSSKQASAALFSNSFKSTSPLHLSPHRGMALLQFQDDSRSLLRCTSEPLERAPPGAGSRAAAVIGSGTLTPTSGASKPRQQAALWPAVAPTAARSRFLYKHNMSPQAMSPSGGLQGSTSPDVFAAQESNASRQMRRKSTGEGGSSPLLADSVHQDSKGADATRMASSGRWDGAGLAAESVQRAAREGASGGPTPYINDSNGSNDAGSSSYPTCVNHQDIERASFEMDQAGDRIESITIIPVNDARSGTEGPPGEVLFVISSRNSNPMVPGFG